MQLQADLIDCQVYHLDEVEAFARVFFTGKEARTTAEEGRLQGLMNRCLDPAVTCFGDLNPADAEVYRFDDDVALKFYRLEKISEGEIGLRVGESGTVAGPVALGTGAANNEWAELSRLIDLINERFGTQFTLADELFEERVREEAAANETLQAAARANTLENFRHVFDTALQGIFVDRMEQNYDLFTKLMSDPALKDVVTQRLRQDVYERILDETPPPPQP